MSIDSGRIDAVSAPPSSLALAAWLVEDAAPGPELLRLPEWLALAEAEGVAAWFALRWRAREAAAGPCPEMHAVLAAAAARELAMAVAERRVVAALLSRQVPFLVLKGAALARWLYPQPLMRPRCDLDLLLPDAMNLSACAAALADAGYAESDLVSLPPSFEQSFIRRGPILVHGVDVHWRMANHPTFADTFNYEELLARAIPIPGLDGALGLSPVHALLHACIHRVSNLRFGAGDRLIWLSDIDRIARRLSEVEWQTLVELACSRNLAGPCLAAFQASFKHFATPLPADAVDALKTSELIEPFRMEHADSETFYLLCCLRNLQGRAWPGFLWNRLFPDFEYMRCYHGVGHRAQLPLGYLRRCISALWRRFGS